MVEILIEVYYVIYFNILSLFISSQRIDINRDFHFKIYLELVYKKYKTCYVLIIRLALRLSQLISYL